MNEPPVNPDWGLWAAGLALLVLAFALGGLVGRLTSRRKVSPPAPLPPPGAKANPPPPGLESSAAGGVVAARRDLLEVVNHEIRTPLNGVIGYADLLLETPLLADQREFATNVRQSAEVLVALLNDIGDYARLQDGQLELTAGTFDFGEIVLAVLDLFAPHAGEKGLELAHNLPAGRRLTVRADATRTRQVLLNLVSNAVNFTSQGHILVHVETSPGPPGFLKCAVIDTGCGLAPEVQARLFAKAGQGEGIISRRFGRQGIGLGLSKSLVDLMGGRIGVLSQPGQGSEFWFQLPLAEDFPAPTAAAADVTAGPRLLIVEPAGVSRTMLVGHFTDGGFSAETADQGGPALARLREAVAQGRPFQSVIFAERLPDLGGRAFARSIRTDPALATLGLVCLRRSGARPANTTALTTLGVVDVVKPVLRPAPLLNAVRVAPTLRPTMDLFQTQAGSDDTDTQVKPPSRANSLGLALLVEDNELNQRVLTEMLKRAGWTSRIADNGAEGVRLACLERYDLILMDCHLPELDGFTATRQIRQNEMATRTGRTPIVAVTAEALADSRERCLAAGMDDCLTKPVRRSELEVTLRRYARVPQGVPATV